MNLFLFTKGAYNMRSSIEAPAKDRTTIFTSKKLINRLTQHLAKTGENQTTFITRAIINQMERDGDITIRQDMEEELDD